MTAASLIAVMIRCPSTAALVRDPLGAELDVELDRSPARLYFIEHVLEPDRLAEAHLDVAEALAQSAERAK